MARQAREAINHLQISGPYANIHQEGSFLIKMQQFKSSISEKKDKNKWKRKSKYLKLGFWFGPVI